MPPSAAIIFDFDGVLADSIGLYYRLYRDVATEFQRSFPPESVGAFREWYNPRWEENYKRLGFSGYVREQAMKWVAERIDYGQVALFPGVKDMLQRLCQTYPLAIASTTSARKIKRVLEREGLTACFQVVIGGGDEGSDKVKMVGEAWRTLGAPPHRTPMVGDTSMDVLSARNWGLPCIAVTYGWMSRQRLESFGPTVLVDQWMDLEPSLVRLLGAD
ncbi:MAG TPA: HAD family hydrolase [Candidatus Xenobia bacterium]|jgi:phosphoglycolate phosphatase